MRATYRLCISISASIVVGVSAASAASASTTTIEQAQRTQDLLTYFYKDPRPDRLHGFVEALGNSPGGGNWMAYPPVTGFLAVIFRTHPDAIKRLIPAQLNSKTSETIAAALRLSGNQAIADKFKARFDEVGSDVTLRTELANLPSRLEDLRIGTPTHLDILWGAAFASGDARFVRMILEYLARTVNESEPAYRDVVWAAVTLFNESATSKFRQELRAKYGETGAQQIIVAAVALWGLKANARQHPFVEQGVATYVHNHAGTNAARALILYGKAGRWD